jgi:glutathione peroxidase
MGRRRTALETPHWNFHKYLIGHDGRIAAVFPTQTEPTDAKVIAAIGRETDHPE